MKYGGFLSIRIDRINELTFYCYLFLTIDLRAVLRPEPNSNAVASHRKTLIPSLVPGTGKALASGIRCGLDLLVLRKVDDTFNGWNGQGLMDLEQGQVDVCIVVFEQP